MEFIFSKNAPKPAGHYSQAVSHNGLMFISAQLPIDPDTGERKTGSIEEQTKQVLKNIEAILNETGLSKENIIKTTVYISEIALWSRINTVYSNFFGDHKPARAVVPTRSFNYGFLIEIEAVAAE
ncbi:MAG: RidA family protein [bacterium]|nr:RidA family protein [bacterium]